MTFFPSLQPLIEEVKKFNQDQQTIIALLQEQNKILTQIKESSPKK